MKRKIDILGVPLHYGANRCGIEFGISNLVKKYPKYEKQIEMIDVVPQIEDFSIRNLKYLNTITKSCSDLAIRAEKSASEDNLPISIGGDHAIALGSIAGVSKIKKIGIIWVDAHGDFNTGETTESGHIHGMPLGSSLGYGDKKLVDCHYPGKKLEVENSVLFGIRSLDDSEEKLMAEAGIRCYKYSEIEERGFEVCLKEASELLKKNNLEVHISFDLDSIDPTEITGVSTPVKSGISKEEGKELFRYMFDNHKISSIDIVEYNPIYEDGEETADYVAELLEEIKSVI